MSGMMVLREMSVECSAKIAMTTLLSTSRRLVCCQIMISHGGIFLGARIVRVC
jgi:hypothetical protein